MSLSPAGFRTFSLIVALILFSFGCTKQKQTNYSFQGRILGHPYNVLIVGPAILDREGYREAAQRLQTRLAEIFTKTEADLPFAEVTRLNEHAASEPFPVTDDMMALLLAVQRVAEQTNGAFDVTIKPLQVTWGVAAGGRPAKVPRPAEIQQAVQKIGYRKLQIDQEQGTVTKRDPSVTVDLSPVVNGYAADQLSQLLLELEWPNHVIQVGEEVITHGHDRLGRPWQISIQRSPRTEGESIIPVSDRGIAVVGNDWFRGEDGKLYSEQIDPRTGRPIEHNVLSASVLSDSVAMASAYSRALVVMGEEEGMTFANEYGLAALLLVQDENETIAEMETAAFRRFLEGDAAPPPAMAAFLRQGASR